MEQPIFISIYLPQDCESFGEPPAGAVVFDYVFCGRVFSTEAGYRISAMHEEIPLLFPVGAAERLGDACVGELEGV